MSSPAVSRSATEALQAMMPPDWASIRTFYQVSEGISVGCLNGKPLSDWRVSGLSQPSFGVAVVLEGECEMAFAGGAPLSIRSGMTILHSTRRQVQGWDDFKGCRPVRVVDIRFSPEALMQLCGSALPTLQGRLLQDCSVPGHEAFLGTLPADSSLCRIASDILRFPCTDRITTTLFMQAKAVEALALILQHLHPGQRTGRLPPAADRRRIQEAYAFIQQQFSAALTIRQLARQTGLSEKRLQAGFAALYGRSVHACIYQARMEAAANLLSQGCSVTEVADRVGLASLSHFIKSFKHYWGVTPKHWRNH